MRDRCRQCGGPLDDDDTTAKQWANDPATTWCPTCTDEYQATVRRMRASRTVTSINDRTAADVHTGRWVSMGNTEDPV